MSNLTIRASAFGGLFDCGYRFEWEHVLGHKKPAGLRALLGTGVHHGTATFDTARLLDAPISADDAAGAFVDALHNPEFEVSYNQDDLTVREAERIGLVLTTKYCLEIAPQFTYTAVEMKLDPLVIDCGGGTTVTLTGTMDRARVAVSDDGIIIPDVKTGMRVVSSAGECNTKGRLPQLGTYQLLYEHTMKEPTIGSQIIGLGTSSKTPVAVSPVFDARAVMVGNDDQPGLISMAAKIFQTGLFTPNPQSALCSEKYCGRWSTCKFHG